MDTIKFNKMNVKMVAHRGLSGIERENTYPAFVAAGNRSYFGIESDVHKTADGKFVIIHDETTRRVSLKTININVEQSSHHAVNHVVLPDLDGSFERQDIRIPTLKDYINICKKSVLLRLGNGIRHNGGFLSEKLYRRGNIPRVHNIRRFFVGERQRFRTDHFGIGKTCTEAVAYYSECKVCHPCHRSKKDVGF